MGWVMGVGGGGQAHFLCCHLSEVCMVREGQAWEHAGSPQLHATTPRRETPLPPH
jgi:hypothetical protein